MSGSFRVSSRAAHPPLSLYIRGRSTGCGDDGGVGGAKVFEPKTLTNSGIGVNTFSNTVCRFFSQKGVTLEKYIHSTCVLWYWVPLNLRLVP